VLIYITVDTYLQQHGPGYDFRFRISKAPEPPTALLHPTTSLAAPVFSSTLPIPLDANPAHHQHHTL